MFEVRRKRSNIETGTRQRCVVFHRSKEFNIATVCTEGSLSHFPFLIFLYSEESEVAGTGKVSPNTHTLPLSILSSQDVFQMDEDEFEIVCGFPKPTPDETLVFTCAAGMRSQNACAFAAQAGYTKLVNYMGGAYEWFSPN